MHLPCFCFYGVYQDAFGVPNDCGHQFIDATIPKIYFDTYVENEKKNGNKTTTIFIINPKLFCERIKRGIIKIGFKEHEIIFLRTNYANYEEYGNEGFIEILGKAPYELGQKNDFYTKQSETRIIINSDNEQLLNEFMNLKYGILEIGPLKEIAIPYIKKIEHELTLKFETLIQEVK